MSKDILLPNGFELPNESRVKSLLFSGIEWQIFDTNGSDIILIARPELAKRWIECGFLVDSLMGEVKFGDDFFRSLSCPRKFALNSVDCGGSPECKADALAFACALKESRKISKDVSFHDAVYVEQYTRLLPTWSLTSHVEDAVVLGTWLTGGVVISTDSFRRLTKLTAWMPEVDLAEIISAAGLSLPPNTTMRSKKSIICSPNESGRNTCSENENDSLQLSTEASNEERKFKLPGRPQLEDFFNEYVISIIFNADKYQVMGIDFPSAIVLHGPPGCGKTFAVERLVEFLDWPSFSIDSNSVGSPYIHQTSKKVSEVFEKAIDSAPSIVVIDEMESFLSERRSDNISGLHHVEEVAEFLRRIPEAVKSRVLVIAMTNMIEMIDPAILRRGRFDHVIEVGMPSRKEVASLVDALLSKLPKCDNLNLENIIDALSGKALSDVSFLIREAARLAAKAGKTQLDQESLEAALESLPKDQKRKNKTIGFA